MRTAYLECFSGISGDMLLGALVDAGVSFDLLAKTAESLQVGARLEQHRVTRGGMGGTKVEVIINGVSQVSATTHAEMHSHDGYQHAHSHSHEQEETHTHDAETEPHQHEHRSLSAILEIIRQAPLSESVKERASQAFMLLGKVEAKIHQKPVEEIHFHEVGAVDTIIDIVCSAVGAEALGVDRWAATQLNVGSGTVHCAHGTLPVPAPATLALLRDAPVYASGPAMERVTPTGAVLLRMLNVEYQQLPAMHIQATGYGAGGTDLPGIPNLLRLIVGEDEFESGTPREPLTVLETVIDDANPQLLGYVSELLLENGASDVYQTAVHMKKNRNGVLLTVLCHPDRLEKMREILFRETTTIGLHWRFEQKMSLPRKFLEVQTPWGAVHMKIAHWADGSIANAQPEYEECRAIAEREEIPLKQVMQLATVAWMERTTKDEAH